jgi:hypothetical protein
VSAAGALTAALVELGEAQPAYTLGQDTLDRCRQALAPEHPITLWAAIGVTLALARLGKAEQARCLGEDTLQRCRLVFGADHPITLQLAEAIDSGHLLDGDATAGRPNQPQ